MNITLTGASGFIGQRLIARLLAGGHHLHLLGRRQPEQMPTGVKFSAWNADAGEPPAESLALADAVIHLAGEPVAQRWTPEVKHKLRSSRVAGTRNVVHALSTLSRRPKTLVCASATGYYGSQGDRVLTEQSGPGEGFLADLCVEWEKEALLAESLGIRVVRLRIGIVLGTEGGALKKMLPLFRLGAGAKLSGGAQWMSWIHVDDIAGLLVLGASASGLVGAVNGTAPNPVRNAEFTAQLASALKRPALFTAPAFALKLAFGEMAGAVLGSQRVLPQAAIAAGYQFQFPALDGALADLIRTA